MRYQSVSTLRPGMIVGKTVLGNNDEVLLKEGVILTDGYIKQLKIRNISGIHITDSPLKASTPSYPTKNDCDEYSYNTNLNKYKYYHKKTATPIERLNTKKEVQSSLNKVINNEGAKFGLNSSADTSTEQVSVIIKDIINNVINNEDVVVNISNVRDIDKEIFTHSINVAVLSIIVGVELGMNAQELEELGIAAILHDIPKSDFPAELRLKEKTGKMNTNDNYLARELVREGVDNLVNLSLPNSTKRAILEHSKRIFRDGHIVSKAEGKISQFAQIIGICDYYDDLISGKPKENGLLPSDAIELVMGNASNLFEVELVQAFLSKVAIYPIGTVVRISDGSLGMVVQNPVRLATRPTVKLLLSKDIVNLADMDNLSKVITAMYTKEEIEQLLKENYK